MALLLSLPMAGCSGSRFGESLSRSFSAPAPAAAPEPATSPAAATANRSAAAEGNGADTSPGSSGAPPNTAAPATNPAPPAAATAPGGAGSSPNAPGSLRSGSSNRPATAGTAPAQRSAPYRVTLLLPQADAAAPAEVVTQALRAAGVPFEVETIERLSSGSGAAAGGSTSPATLPGRRPAPEPR